MFDKSLEGLTLAFIFDWAIILLIVLGPFILPSLARIGAITRLLAGFILISLGLFLGVLFFGSGHLDPDKHWVLVNNLESISMMFIPFSLVLFIILPPSLRLARNSDYCWVGLTR